MLDRLVRGTVLADADRIVREDEDNVNAHQRREPNRRPAVVGEDEETRTERDESTVEGDPVQDRTHRMLTDAEVEIASTIVVAGEVAAVLDVGEGRFVEVGRAAEEVPHTLRDHLFGA